MRIIGDIVLCLVTGVVYWWWTDNLSFFGMAPNFIFIAALASAIIAGPGKALTYGFCLGIYLDLLATDLFGAYALTYTLMAYGIYVMKRHLDLVSVFSQIVAALALTVLTMLFYQGLSLALGRIDPVQLKAFLVEPFLNAVFAPVVFYFFVQLRRRFGIL